MITAVIKVYATLLDDFNLLISFLDYNIQRNHLVFLNTEVFLQLPDPFVKVFNFFIILRVFLCFTYWLLLILTTYRLLLLVAIGSLFLGYASSGSCSAFRSFVNIASCFQTRLNGRLFSLGFHLSYILATATNKGTSFLRSILHMCCPFALDSLVVVHLVKVDSLLMVNQLSSIKFDLSFHYLFKAQTFVKLAFLLSNLYVFDTMVPNWRSILTSCWSDWFLLFLLLIQLITPKHWT